jgi:putative salt-induced outer membrane protein
MTWRPLSLLVAIAIGATSAIQANAQEVGGPPPEKETGPWTGKAAIGFLATSGNTESTSLNSAFTIAYAIGKWAHSLEASAIKASESDQATAEAYRLGWKSEFNLSEHNFLFGRVNWRKDRFSGYEQQLSESVGYGRRLIDTGVHFLNVEIGAGARQAELTDGTSEDEFIVRSGLHYQWKFSETAQFVQDFTVESGAENTYAESVSALKTSLVGTLALVASYTVKNNSDVPIDTERTDTYAALSLEYPF